MPRKNNLTNADLMDSIEQRGQKILERFGQVAVTGVNDPLLLLILKEVTVYWKDAYRPALTSFCCEAVGGQPETANDASVLMSLASAGIGLHDDIIDKTPKKHFRTTILGLYGVEAALLVGDLLVLKAWSMFQEIIRKTAPSIRIADIMEAYGSLSLEICETELMEFSSRHNLDIDLSYYTKILWKSMADTDACARIGAMIGCGSENQVQALGEFGRKLGFMYRLGDDVKDCLNLEGNLPHRLMYETIPLPLLYAAKSSKERYSEINSILEKSPITPLDVKDLLETCFEAEAFVYIRNLAKQNEKEGVSLLGSLSVSNARNMLALMIRKSLSDVAALCL